MNSVRSNTISLKYQIFTTLGSKDIEIINSDFVAKTQFLYLFRNSRFKQIIFSKYVGIILSDFVAKTQFLYESLYP